jgi:DNA-directed RNA polymerase subunit omega
MIYIFNRKERFTYMIHPSYVDLMKVVNKGVEEGETPVINSRYSIVMATAKRARQIVDGDEPLVKVSRGEKPLSTAVDELNQGEIRILAEDEVEEEFSDPAAEAVSADMTASDSEEIEEASEEDADVDGGEEEEEASDDGELIADEEAEE